MFCNDEVIEIVRCILSLRPELKETFGNIELKENTSGSLSVIVGNVLILRVINKKRGQEFGVKKQLEKSLSNIGIEPIPLKDDGWIYFSSAVFDPNGDRWISLQAILFDYIYNMFKGESFGCCCKYVECSDAKVCLHHDLLYAKGCMYRKNLESGKIFYGINKNV